MEERGANAEKLRRGRSPQPPRAVEMERMGGHQQDKSSGKVPLSQIMWRICTRNETPVNKCDRMLRFFEIERTLLVVTCDFDMYFCCLFGGNGAVSEEK